jgi:hypothetical protein
MKRRAVFVVAGLVAGWLLGVGLFVAALLLGAFEDNEL